jgi:predicted GIY-YIG superfamily endonuclease
VTATDAAQVYIARDATDCVLYVGMTQDLEGRLQTHKAASRWWALVASVSVEDWPTRDAALRREDELIRELDPPYNNINMHTWWKRRDEEILRLRLCGMNGADIARVLECSTDAVGRATKRLQWQGRLGVTAGGLQNKHARALVTAAVAREFPDGPTIHRPPR